jgi:hypothetical protein
MGICCSGPESLSIFRISDSWIENLSETVENFMGRVGTTITSGIVIDFNWLRFYTHPDAAVSGS